MIRGSTNLPVDELQRKFDGIQKQIQSITKLFSDATIFLPAFEIKQYQQVDYLFYLFLYNLFLDLFYLF